MKKIFKIISVCICLVLMLCNIVVYAEPITEEELEGIWSVSFLSNDTPFATQDINVLADNTFETDGLTGDWVFI